MLPFRRAKTVNTGWTDESGLLKMFIVTTTLSSETRTPPRASFSNRSNSFIADNQYLTDRDNRYRVGEDSYMHGKIIPLYRTVRITDEERAVVPVVNPGAVAMEWTVEADEPWIIGERDSGGSLVPEALDSFYVYVEDDLRSADVQSGRIRLLAGSSTLVIGVDVLSRSENPAHTRLSFSFYLCA